MSYTRLCLSLQRLYHQRRVQGFIFLFLFILLSFLLNLLQPFLELPLQAEPSEPVVLLQRALLFKPEPLHLLLQELHLTQLLQLGLGLPPPPHICLRLWVCAVFRAVPLLSWRILEGDVLGWGRAFFSRGASLLLRWKRGLRRLLGTRVNVMVWVRWSHNLSVYLKVLVRARGLRTGLGSHRSG